MTSFLRSMLVLVGLLVGLSASPSDGGGGDSGVWILPSCGPVYAQPFGGRVVPRKVFELTNLVKDQAIEVSPSMGTPHSVLVGDSSLTALPTSVSGRIVTIDLPVLVAIRDAEGSAVGVIVDAAGLGYTIRIQRLGATGLRFLVY